jgi:hypothetical protein
MARIAGEDAMTGRLTIEASEASSFGVPVGVPHLYLVFEDLGTGAEYVLRAGPRSAWQLAGAPMRIEVNVPIDRSADDRGGDTPAERGSRDLAFPGISDDAAWSIMVKYARALVADRYEYDLFGENSNAFVAALMKAAGGTPEAMLPRGVTADEAIGFSHWREIVRDVAPPGDGVFRGTGGADVLTGLQMDEHFDLLGGNDVLRAGRGNDVGQGGSGNDRMLGQAGNDTLSGGPGRDTLIGGGGSDVLRGGSGADVFQFAAGEGRDRILDFADGVDRIRITDPAVDSLADLAVRPKGSGTEIAFGGTVIEIAGLDHHAFGLADLILVDPLIG